MALIIFNPEEPCGKCSNKAVEVRYQQKNQPGFRFEDPENLPAENEWLKCTCLRCGYEFLRAPLV